MISIQKRKVQKAIELLFTGLDDPITKEAMLVAYAGKDPSYLNELQAEKEKEMEEILKQMELKSVEEVIIENKSTDIITNGNH